MTNQLFSRVGVRHEVALNVLGTIIAHYSEAIAAEREEATPNEVMIVTAQKTRDELCTVHEDLDPNADETIKRIITQYGQQARDLYQ